MIRDSHRRLEGDAAVSATEESNTVSGSLDLNAAGPKERGAYRPVLGK